MQHLESHKLLTSSQLFQQLSTEEIELVLARLQFSHYERGIALLQRGVWHGRLYIVASGIVSVLLQDTAHPPASDDVQGNEIQAGQHTKHSQYRVATLGPGECFGEMSLLTGEPPMATVRTEEETDLWSLAHADFLALTATCPTLLRNMNSILSQRLARTNQQLLLEQAAEVLCLETLDPEGSPYSQALAYHIAEALALRSQRRVLLLELCSSDESYCLHFANRPGQLRPELLACANDTTLLQAHDPTLRSDTGEPLAALTTLAATREQLAHGAISLNTVLFDLMLRYDYILLSITSKTSLQERETLLHGLKQRPLRTIRLLSAQALPPTSSHNPLYAQTSTLFVTHVGSKTVLALQDHYAERLNEPVKRLLPADEPLLERCWQERCSVHKLAPHAALTQGVDFVARFIAHQTVGIAFGGGGARGFAHLGVLAGLLEHEVPLDYIAACSIGILAPGMHLIGKSLEESERMFLEVQQHLGQWQIPRTSLFSNRGLKLQLQRACGELRFEDLTTPFAMVAADLATRSGVVLDRGPIWQAGLASVALPGIFPPVIIGEHILVDAGMHDPVPVRLARRMGADILLASELGGQDPPSLISATSWSPTKEVQEAPHIVDLLLRSYDLAMATIGMHSIREADIVIRPKLHRVSLRQFSEGRSFIASGRETLEQVIPQLRQRLPWLT